MNDQHEPLRLSYESGQEAQARLLSAPVDAAPSGAAEATEAARSMLATHTDPSIDNTETPAEALEAEEPGKGRRGVSWVRPTDLIAHSGAKASGIGIDFQAEIARRLRTGIKDGAREIGGMVREQGRWLADLSVGGRDYPATEPVTVESPELGR